MESNDIRELFSKEIVEKASKEMTDYAVSDELALKMMLRATQDAAYDGGAYDEHNSQHQNL